MKRRARNGIVYGIIIAGFLIISHSMNHTITVIAEALPVERGHCIIIDAGHGGIDGGAISCTGKLESMINLEISCRLRDLLQLLGFKTKMIRESDISVYTQGQTIAQKKVSDLKKRVQIVNDTEDGILISIHQNYFQDGRYSGGQVFYADKPGSDILAKQIQTSLVTNLNPKSKRESKKSESVYLLEHINCPSVLIECGFLSNSEEEALLRSAEYQKKLSCVISTSIAEYLSNT